EAVMPPELLEVLAENEVAVRLDFGPGGERVLNAAAELPAGEIDRPLARVVQLDELQAVQVVRRVVEDFVDDDAGLRGAADGEEGQQHGRGSEEHGDSRIRRPQDAAQLLQQDAYATPFPTASQGPSRILPP